LAPTTAVGLVINARVLSFFTLYDVAIHEGQGRTSGGKGGRWTANGVLICAYIKSDIIHGADKSEV